ncbi:MAG: (5-formylfuran-3-yl)methyl phosphate synthase [Methanonatronarchaeales archaeon]|nr:(5-formylfuran-3-yl)methyl phosphate synthase [Methanonatronarchaeales archaeon]
MTRLLVSPRSVDEVEATVSGGADVVDVKRPAEGSLGANYPWVLRKIREAVPEEVETSAAIGDMDARPGLASLAADAVASAGFDYVKVGLHSVNYEGGLKVASGVARAVDGRATPVIAGYGDYALIDGLAPIEISEIAEEAGADVAMLDTAVKDGSSLFDHLSEEEVAVFIEDAEGRGLDTALAGSLDLEAVELCADLGTDIVGVRGAACGGDRGDSIDEGCVRKLAGALS